MMRIKTIIIDDEQAGRDTLEKLLEMYCTDVWVAAKASNGEEGIQLIKDLNPDIVFLDIMMPGMNGFDILENCKNMNFKPIFVSAHGEYLLKAIKFAAFDFLLKPVHFKELQECIARFKEAPPKTQQHKNTSTNPPHNLALPTKEGYHFVNTTEIIYCKADDNYTTFTLTDNTKILVCRTLKDCEELLTFSEYFRCHQSYLINLFYIKKYLKGMNTIIMKNGDEISISTRKKDEFSQLIEKL